MPDDIDLVQSESGHTHVAVQDFVAGTLAGVALTLVGHPFDTGQSRAKHRMCAHLELCSVRMYAARM
jgi:hypothetical protein